MNELTGRELDVALARAMGWTEYTDEAFCTHGGWRKPDGEQTWLPAFSESVDALIRDVLPKCRERGAKGWQLTESDESDFYAMILMLVDRFAGRGGTPALAFARACLSALEAE